MFNCYGNSHFVPPLRLYIWKINLKNNRRLLVIRVDMYGKLVDIFNRYLESYPKQTERQTDRQMPNSLVTAENLINWFDRSTLNCIFIIFFVGVFIIFRSFLPGWRSFHKNNSFHPLCYPSMDNFDNSSSRSWRY